MSTFNFPSSLSSLMLSQNKLESFSPENIFSLIFFRVNLVEQLTIVRVDKFLNCENDIITVLVKFITKDSVNEINSLHKISGNGSRRWGVARVQRAKSAQNKFRAKT